MKKKQKNIGKVAYGLSYNLKKKWVKKIFFEAVGADTVTQSRRPNLDNKCRVISDVICSVDG